MTPQEFLDQVVQPNIADLEKGFGDLRHAYNAVMAVENLAAHIHQHCLASVPGTLASDAAFKEALAQRSPEFAIVRDLGKAQKHVVLTQGSPVVTRADQVAVEQLGWGQGRWGEARWGSPPQVHVTLNTGDVRAVDYLVRTSAEFLRNEMLATGCL